ncbi:MAG: HAMP domain-containing sensor histidine kinase [Actinomycetota bacterium]
MKLRARIALVAAVAVAVAVLLISTAAYFAARNELRGEVDESLIQRAERIQRMIGEAALKDPFGSMARPLPIFGGGGPDFDTVYYQLTLPTGDVLTPPDQEPLSAVPADQDVDEPVLSDESISGVHIRMVTFGTDDLGTIQIARPLTEVDATLAGLAIALSVFGLVGILLAAGAGLLVARSALKPIDELAEAAEHVAETQDLGARIDIETNDEVGRLAGRFNDMLAALEESRAEQRRLVRDAGHELRTPITALRTNIELLGLGYEMTDEQRTELIEAAEAEVKDLSVLVGEVIDLASDRYTEDPIEDLRLDEIAESSIGRADRRTGVEIVLHGEPSSVRGRRAALARAVDNLLDNAVKWSPADGTIEVSVAGGRMAVRDHGPGIDEDDRGRIFDRFYRSPSARSMPGSGLGLSIVQQIVDAHGGTVFVEPADGGGAVVGFVLNEADSGS